MAKLLLDELMARIAALETAVLGHKRTRETRSQRARRKGCSTKTIARRVKAGTEGGDPHLVNGRWFFWRDEPEPGTPDTPELRAKRDPRRHNKLHIPHHEEFRSVAPSPALSGSCTGGKAGGSPA